MSEASVHGGLLATMLVLSAIIFAFSLFVTGPYGRYPRTRWSGPALPSWIAWMLMEAPQPVGFFLCFLASARRTNPVALVFLGMWTFHYAYRTLIYPFLNRSRTMPLAIVGTGFLLNIGFSYLNGRWLFTLGPERSASWLSGPPFLLGTLLFFGGFILCAASDGILRRLRPAGVTGYRIPMGGAYRWVSCPNYLGELMQWIGWTLATWSLAGLAIALVTAANLVPRARLHHRWYQRTFPEYPVERRALVPFVF